ncbi:UNVERIFIED_CONTAM: hypothetical protein GTU68_038975 [Idotea baltica]|nr:hypothetical protein [Idotea baltica]
MSRSVGWLTSDGGITSRDPSFCPPLDLRPPTEDNAVTGFTLEQASPFLRDVLQGLNRKQKTLPCKYLYDQRGSELFDRICDLDEYYVTRTELAILEQNIESIAFQIDQGVMLVEPGSGSSLKTRLLLNALDSPRAYVPVDISEEHLLKTADGLRSVYPDLDVLPVVADFSRPFALPNCDPAASHVAMYFPGSTIGNFTTDEARRFLQQLAGMLGPQGGLLLGIDLQKDVATLEAAYNDELGVTAAFNLNLLHRVNGELDGDFDVAAFEHKAVYNPVDHRIEISIVSLKDQTAHVGDWKFFFAADEEILTEYSHKYTIGGFEAFAAEAGFSLHQHWTDDQQKFAILHLVLDE